VTEARDYDQEHRDQPARRYAYEFDWVLRRYLLRTLLPHCRPGGRTLELGCYQGDMTGLLLEQFPDLTVVEASAELCRSVGQRFAGRVTVVHSTFENARIEPVFEQIFLVHTLEHLDDPVGVLARVRHWLAPGANLLVAVPNANALSRQIAVRMGLVDFNSAVTPAEQVHGHRITYSLDRLEHHLRAAGYEVADSGGVLVKPLANFQFDRALAAGIVDEAYLDGCYELGRIYPDLCASLYAVCRPKRP
jgi:SAM-dependent methyltransferase